MTPSRTRSSAQLRQAVAEHLLVAGLRQQARAERSEAERSRLAFLLETTQNLVASLEPVTILQTLVDAVVPELGEAAFVYVAEDDGQSRQLNTRSSELLRACSPDWWDAAQQVIWHAVRRVLAGGAPELGLTRATRAWTADCDCGEVAYIVVPLSGRGHTRGALSLLSLAGQRQYSREDLALAEAVGNQAGLALDNADLYEEQRRLVLRLREVQVQLHDAQRESLLENERMRIARELHDHVEQTFFAIGLTAVAALEHASDESVSTSAAEALARVEELSTAGAEHLRAAIFALHRTRLSGLGLTPALWKLVTAFRRRTRMEADLVVTGRERPVPVDVAEALYAVAREALSNVERHADARVVVLTFRTNGKSASLTVRDDGHGVPRAVLQRMGSSTIHYGLRGLRERMRTVHGTFSCRSGQQGGFVVRARAPLPVDCAS